MKGTLVKIKGDGHDYTAGGFDCSAYDEPAVGVSFKVYDNKRFGGGIQTSTVKAVRKVEKGFEFDTLNSTYQFIRKEAA